MAITSICASLTAGQDSSCQTPARKYYQQAVLINKTDIETMTVSHDAATGAYKVVFTLKVGKKGFKFIGPEAGSNFYGSFDKSRSGLGHPQYKHNVQVLLVGADQDAKNILDSLDKGSYIAALQLKDGTVEIYGITNGLTTGDYTYNLQEGGGGAPIVLSSLDDAPEGKLPLVYESAVPGSETADFDADFENVGP